MPLPDFDTADINQLSVQTERDDVLFAQAIEIFDGATLPDKLAIVTTATWLTTYEFPQLLRLDYSDVSPTVHRAIDIIKQMSDDCRLRLSYSLIQSLVPTDDEDIIPPDCEFDDGLPNDLGNNPPSLMIA